METCLILILISTTLSLPGVFLTLKKASMTADAISHTTLLGIVLAFFITYDIHSPLLIIFAALTGVITVVAIERIQVKTKLHQDASIGIVYSFFFALAVILITKYAKNTHLSVDLVLMGEVLYSSLRTISIAGVRIPKAIVQMSILFVINAGFVSLFYKELKLICFDPVYAKVSGFKTDVLNLVLMSVVSLSCVVAFDSVGSILVLSFFVCPAACAYLISQTLSQMIKTSYLFAILMSTAGYFLAIALNVNLAGTCAFVGGVMVLVVALVGRGGIVEKLRIEKQMKLKLKYISLINHIANHEDTNKEEQIRELGFDTIDKHINWPRADFESAYQYLKDNQYLNEDLDQDGCITLTQKGWEAYRQKSLD